MTTDVVPAVGTRWRSPLGGPLMMVVGVDGLMISIKRADSSRRQLATAAGAQIVALSEWHDWTQS
jgi:hypothetical protein